MNKKNGITTKSRLPTWTCMDGKTANILAGIFLKGEKSGDIIYFNCPSWHYNVEPGSYNQYVCVDGLQRLTSICRFINNEIKVFGSFFSEYKDPMMVNRYTLKINVNDLKSEKEVLQWYIEFNSGGTPHTVEEIERVKT